MHPRQSWYISYFTIVAIKAGIALTQYCQMRNLSDALDGLSLAADMTQFMSKLNTTSEKFKTQDTCIYLYINTAFFFCMIAGNYLHFKPDKAEMSFCKRTSGYYQQLHSISFLLILFGYAQSLYYLVCCFIVLGKHFCGHADDEEEEQVQVENNEQQPVEVNIHQMWREHEERLRREQQEREGDNRVD